MNSLARRFSSGFLLNSSPIYLYSLRSFLRIVEYQWFFTALSVLRFRWITLPYLPFNCLAISAHLFPSCFCKLLMVCSSSGVHSPRFTEGSNLFSQRFRHCFVVRFVPTFSCRDMDMADQWPTPCCSIQHLSALSSSSFQHLRTFPSEFNLTCGSILNSM